MCLLLYVAIQVVLLTNLGPSSERCLELLAANVDESVVLQDGVHDIGHAPLKAIGFVQRFVSLIHKEGKGRIFAHGSIVTFRVRAKFLQFYPTTRAEVT